MVSEAESLMFGVFRAEGTFKSTTQMLSKESRTNRMTYLDSRLCAQS